MQMAKLAATRSTCLRRKVGAVIVKDSHVLSTGYNGSPRGVSHCEEKGCLRVLMNVPSGTRHELCRGVHAEQNAVTQAAYFGTSVKDATIYTTTFPCSLCNQLRYQGDRLQRRLHGRSVKGHPRRDRHHHQTHRCLRGSGFIRFFAIPPFNTFALYYIIIKIRVSIKYPK